MPPARTLLLAALGLATGCGPTPLLEAPPPPGPLQIGIAVVDLPAPIGIGTAGFGGFAVDGNPSPFADRYPATERLHGQPEFKAIAISRGPGHELVFVRSDTVGVFQQLRRSVLDELEDRLGRDLDDVLVLGGTHTHSGPGRVIDGGGPFDLIADTFFPEFYDRLVLAIADAVEQALADLAPGRVGRAEAVVPEAHQDRRCEDGLDYTNDRLPLLVVEREGELAAVLGAYAVHGTVLHISELTLSQDVFGAIEQAIEDRFDHPVEVALFNAWGGDMSPGDPPVDAGPGPELPAGYERMERIGTFVADEVEAALTDVTWMEDPIVAAETHRVRLDRVALGYDDDTFPYDHGAVYCGGAVSQDCDPATTVDGLDASCLAFPEDYPAPNQTLFTAGQIGDLHFITFPGEPGTLLAEEVMADLEAWGDVPQVWFIGYGQDYTGYSLLEEDWWQGGYEAGGALWGPRQGEYLRDMAVDTYRRYRLPDDADALLEPPPLPGFVTDYVPRVPTPARSVGDVLVDVSPTYGPEDVVTFTVAGTDPWLGTPVATLHRADGTVVTRPNGMPIESRDYTMWVDLVPEPSYREAMSAPERLFRWTFSLPVSHRTPGWPDLDGDYRLSVAIPLEDGTVHVVESSPFTVTP